MISYQDRLRVSIAFLELRTCIQTFFFKNTVIPVLGGGLIRQVKEVQFV